MNPPRPIWSGGVTKWRSNRLKLEDVLSGIEYSSTFDIKKIDFDVKRITCHSQDVREGDLFVAIKGEHFDGHNFLNRIMSKGVNVAIVERMTLADSNFIQIKVSNTRRILSILARNFYKDPSRNIKVIGITGTNGKTTVSYLLENIFKNAGLKTGLIGTINYKAGGEVIDATHTTPDSLVLNNLLGKMVNQSLPYCIMEVSSHGLDQGRVEDIRFRAAAFTNLSHEHLDYHKTLENYLEAKLKLFKYLDKDSYAVVNRDSPYFDELRYRIDIEPITYGIEKNSDIMAKDIKMNLEESRFYVSTPGGDFEVKSHLMGLHNIYNMLTATAIAMNEGLHPDVIKKGIETLDTIPGRLERIECGQDFHVFVDYAHTEDALKNVLGTLRRLSKNKIILVFGCGGDRDRAKRPKMGRVAAELADFTVITLDNPRSENPRSIAKEIENGFKGLSSKYVITLDRFKAIKKALLAADEDVIVLIAGKGHERSQIFKNKIVPFNDKKVVHNILKGL